MVTPVRRTVRGPYAKSTTTRRAILTSAMEVFGQSGYRGGSLRAVAERVGISEAGLLHHFPNKSSLLQAVLELRDDEAERMFVVESTDGRELLDAFLKLAAFNETTPGMTELYCVVSAEATDPGHPAHGFFDERYRYSVGLVEKAFATLHAQGGLRSGVEPHDAAQAFVALWDGLQVQWLYARDRVAIARTLRRYINSLVTEPLIAVTADPTAGGATQSSEPR